MSTWTTKFRKQAGRSISVGGVLGLVATAVVLAGPAQAEEVVKISAKADSSTPVSAKPAASKQGSSKQASSKQESIGVVSGLAIGALAGGPIGAILGAAGGAVLGDHYHKQSVEKSALAADLTTTKAARARVEGDLAQTRSQGELMGEALDRTNDLELAVGFRTADSTVTDDDVVRLQKIGALASSLGKVKVRVTGYADPRGSKAINDALSEQRADAVAHVLASTGFPQSQLVVESRGAEESKSVEGDLDGYAMERRVTVRIEQTGEGLAAAFRK